MKPYTKTYFNSLGLDPIDPVKCEICSSIAVDIHHIDARGMGGTSIQNEIAYSI